MSSKIIKCKKIDRLIRMKSTGAPAELAKKIGVSETYAKNLIASMRSDLNMPIKYTFSRGYYYAREGGLYIGFIEKDAKVAEKDQSS